MNYKFKATLCVLLCSAGFIYCGPASMVEVKSPLLDTIHIGDQIWMKHNTSLLLPNSFWYERDSINNHHVDPSIFVIETIHGFQNQIHPFIS